MSCIFHLLLLLLDCYYMRQFLNIILLLLFHGTVVHVHVLLSNFMDHISVLVNFFIIFYIKFLIPHFLLFLSVYFRCILGSTAIDPFTLI
jgi:hypothetical protein